MHNFELAKIVREVTGLDVKFVYIYVDENCEEDCLTVLEEYWLQDEEDGE